MLSGHNALPFTRVHTCSHVKVVHYLPGQLVLFAVHHKAWSYGSFHPQPRMSGWVQVAMHGENGAVCLRTRPPLLQVLYRPVPRRMHDGGWSLAIGW